MSNKKAVFSLPLFLTALGHFTTDLGQGALPVLLPFLQKMFTLTYTQVAIIVMVQSFTSSLIQPAFGYMIDKISMPILLPISIFIACLGTALLGFAPSYYMILAAVVLFGIGSASFHPQAAAAMSSISSKETRGRSMGIFSVGGNLGFAAGALFMAFLLTKISGGTENTIYFLIPGAITALLILFNLQQIAPAQPKKSGTATTDKAKRTIPWVALTFLLLFIFIRSTVHFGLQTYIPLYYVNYLNLDASDASYVISLFLFGGAFGTFFGATMSDRFGRKNVIIASMVLSLPLIYLLLHSQGILAYILFFLAGGALISSFATTLVFAQEMLPGNVGMAAGLTVGFSVGLGGVGTTLLGIVADSYGLPTILNILAFLPLLGILTALKLPKSN